MGWLPGGNRLKVVLYGLLGLIVLVVAAVLIGPSFVDWNAYKEEIASQVERATGRSLTIEGDIKLTIVPAPAF